MQVSRCGWKLKLVTSSISVKIGVDSSGYYDHDFDVEWSHLLPGGIAEAVDGSFGCGRDPYDNLFASQDITSVATNLSKEGRAPLKWSCC
jgi:hypothetical protein